MAIVIISAHMQPSLLARVDAPGLSANAKVLSRENLTLAEAKRQSLALICYSILHLQHVAPTLPRNIVNMVSIGPRDKPILGAYLDQFLN